MLRSPDRAPASGFQRPLHWCTRLGNLPEAAGFTLTKNLVATQRAFSFQYKMLLLTAYDKIFGFMSSTVSTLTFPLGLAS